MNEKSSFGQMLAMLLLITAAVEEAEKQIDAQFPAREENGVKRPAKEM